MNNDALVKLIGDQVRLQVDNDMYKNGVMRLGQFIDALKKCDQDKEIYFDFYWFVPHGLRSYRGYYDHLAFGFSGDVESVKVSEVLKLSQDALEKTFEGYKGGDFTMTENTPLWVGNYGECRDTAIVGVMETEHRVIIKTAFVE